MMDVKYAGDMYKVGDQSIMLGRLGERTTTTLADGKTETSETGLIDVISSTAHTKRLPWSTGPKTTTTPERKAAAGVSRAGSKSRESNRLG